MHFLPTPGDPPTGLFYGLDGSRRLVAAVYGPCSKGPCELKPAITLDDVPEPLARAVVSRLVAELEVVPEVSHLTLDAEAEGLPGRTLLYTWTRPGDPSDGKSGDRLLFGAMTEEGPCVTEAIPLTVDRDGPVALHTLEKDPIRPAIVKRLLQYVSHRFKEFRRQGCAGPSHLRPFILIKDDGIFIFEEEDVSAPAARHAGIQDAMELASVSLPATGQHQTVAVMQAMAADVIRKRARLYEPESDDRPVAVSLPADVSPSDRGRIYHAIRPYLAVTEMASLDFDRMGRRDSPLYSTSFDEGTKLIVDAEGPSSIIRLRSEAGLPGVDVIRQATRYGPSHEASQRLPPVVELIEAGKRWLLVTPNAPDASTAREAVWLLDTAAKRLGTLPGFDTLTRLRVLTKVGMGPVPFCAFKADSSAWYRKRNDGSSCNSRVRESHVWSVWNGTEWTGIHTALSPSTALLAQARAVLPSISPPGVPRFVRVGNFDKQGLILETVSECKTGAVRLHALHHSAEKRAKRMEWLKPSPVGGLKKASKDCLIPRDLDAVREVFARRPGSALNLVGPVASIADYSDVAIPVAVEAGGTGSHVGLLGQRATLFAGAGASGLDWPKVVRAFVAIRLAKSLRQDQPDLQRLHLVLGPLRKGWLVSDTTHTYSGKVDGEAPVSVSRRPLKIREDALKPEGRRKLVVRLLRGLYDRPEREWPESLLVDGAAPYLAVLDGGVSRVVLAASSEISDVAEVELLNVPESLDSGSVVRRALRKGIAQWNDKWKDKRSPSFLVQETEAGSHAVLMAADARELRTIGYWTDDANPAVGPTLVDVRIATPSPPARDLAQAIAEGLVGLAPPGTMPILEGGPRSLRLCSDVQDSYRLVGDGTRQPINIGAYIDGRHTACNKIANDKYGVLINRLFKAVTTKLPPNVAAILLLSDSVDGVIARGLIARANGTDYTLLSPGAEETGCKSGLRGTGARLLAQIVASNPGITCLQQAESPPGHGRHHAGVASADGRLYLAHHEGNGTCNVVLAPHDTKPPKGSDAVRYLEDFARDTSCFSGPGRWFHVFDTAFGVVADRIWAPGQSLGVRIAAVDDRSHETWLARWLLSPGVHALSEELERQSRTAEATSRGVRLSIDLDGQTRVFLDGRTCGVSRRPLAHRGFRVPQELLPLAETSIDGKYSCGNAVFDLGQAAATKFAHVTVKDQQQMECLLESPGSDAFKGCVDQIAIVHEDGTTVLDPGRHDRDNLHELVSDLYKNDENTNRAGRFLTALDSDWQVKWMDWRHYRYILRRDQGTQMYRFNIFTPRDCLQIEAAALRRELDEWRLPASRKCPGNALECVLEEFAIAVGADDRGPLWFEELFQGDPRYAIQKASEDCK